MSARADEAMSQTALLSHLCRYMVAEDAPDDPSQVNARHVPDETQYSGSGVATNLPEGMVTVEDKYESGGAVEE